MTHGQIVNTTAARWRTVAMALRRSPAVHSVVYLGGAAMLLHASSRWHGRDAPWSLEATHVTTLPLVTLWTWSCMRARGDTLVWWNEDARVQGVRQAAAGMALGTAAFLVVVGTAALARWVQFPAWGWDTTSKRQVARTVLLHSIGHGAIAWNEELVFRGYGLHTARAAVGQPAAVLGLTTLFALGHGISLRVFVSQAVAGLALTSLRVSGGSLWLPIGYHFAWNVMQTAVLGPPDGLPSIRPMHPQGPELWLGRPGYPEPGLLAMLVELSIAVGSALVWWRRRRRA